MRSLGSHSEFKVNLRYKMRPYLKNKKAKLTKTTLAKEDIRAQSGLVLKGLEKRGRRRGRTLPDIMRKATTFLNMDIKL